MNSISSRKLNDSGPPAGVSQIRQILEGTNAIEPQFVRSDFLVVYAVRRI